jgi:hypothetical protein
VLKATDEARTIFRYQRLLPSLFLFKDSGAEQNFHMRPHGFFRAGGRAANGRRRSEGRTFQQERSGHR